MPCKLSQHQKRIALDEVLRLVVEASVRTGLTVSDFRDWINYRLYQAEGVEHVKDAIKSGETLADEYATHSMKEELDELLDAEMDDPQGGEAIAEAFRLGEELDPDFETPLIQRTDTIQEMEDAITKAAKAERRK